MGVTRDLAYYLADIEFDQLPTAVQDRAKLAVLDILGVALGGFGLQQYSGKFLRLAKAVGGGVSEATLIGDGATVSLPMAVFANTALATALDYCDHVSSKSGLCFAWPGALAVPAALGAVEVHGGDGKDFLAAIVAGYECEGRILRSVDMSPERERELKGETISVFAAAAAAARGLRLDRDQMLSTIGMAGIQTPVSAGYKWLMDTGLRPRKDIKQGWAWMAHTGAFAAESARLGFEMTQDNNILDGDRGLWRMLGMEFHYEDEVTRNLGDDFVLLNVETKRIPGCSITNTGILGARDLISENTIDMNDIVRIDVTTNRRSGIEEDDKDPKSIQDMQFSVPYQVGAALSGYPRGPQWYTLAADSARQTAAKTFLGFDEECGEFWESNHRQLSKVRITTRDGGVYETKVEDKKLPVTPDEIRRKFHEVASQVIGDQAAEDLSDIVDHLEEEPNLTHLLSALEASGAGIGF